MDLSPFSPEDIQQLAGAGLTEAQAFSQLKTLRGPPPFLRLVRPCTLGDGIRTLPEEAYPSLMAIHGAAANQGRCLKFVPASGSATRMFASQLRFAVEGERKDLSEIVAAAKAGVREAEEFLQFNRNLSRFAFFPRLREVVAQAGLDLDVLQRRGAYQQILDFLLTPRGLGYANRPKGLIDFHRYGQETRTAFEEHLVEAAQCVRDRHGICRIHFTVSSESLTAFRDLWGAVESRYEANCGVRFQIDFSAQKPSTDTIAVDLDNRPFHREDGRLLLRPGGHGALIENLNDLQGDIVFIKNIDNVVPDRLKAPSIMWRGLLAGLLLTTQSRVFSYLEAMAQEPVGEDLVREAMEFARAELCLAPPPGRCNPTLNDRRAFLVSTFRRPLRVCGLVRNQGEPGGGPFWVEDSDGTLSLQIVESVQVDQQSPDQCRIWDSPTHFNPVDIACGLRDAQGSPFDLRGFTDPAAVLITRKTMGGRELKALEHPGLWNGGMARWNTIFVEVPLITFNPVKTINDLLRDEHQA